MTNHSSKTANTNSGAMIVEWPSSQQRRQQSPPPRNSHRQKGKTEKSRSKRKGTVNFSHATRVEFVRGGYTEEELVATYYTDEEYAQIKKSMRATVKAMRKAHAKKIDLESLIADSEEYSTRGLEHFASSAELEKRALKRDRVVSEVLNEQNRQRQVESTNVYTIAAASSICSKWSRDVSLREAALDETQAKAHQGIGGVLTAGAVSPTLGCSDVARQGQGRAGCVRAGRRDSSTRTSSASSGVAKLQTAHFVG